MPKNLMNAVRLSRVWLIRSPVTNHVYLDAERRAYAFFEGYQADKFVAATEGTVADPPAFFDGKALRGQIFSDGGTSLVLSRGYETETVPVGPRNVPLKFYRCDLNAWLNLLNVYRILNFYFFFLKGKQIIFYTKGCNSIGCEAVWHFKGNSSFTIFVCNQNRFKEGCWSEVFSFILFFFIS